jgi:response regulator RpfG family c-di-GMP phosphodiesterase
MRVLFVSGYAEGTSIQHGILDAGVHFLQKPVTPESLTRKVREVLDKPHGEAST